MRPRLLHVQARADMAGCERSCELFLRYSRDYESVVLVLGSPGQAVDLWQRAGASVEFCKIGTSRSEEYRALARSIRKYCPKAVIFWTNMRLGLFASAAWRAGVRRVATHVGNPVRLAPRNRLAARAYSLLPGGRSTTLIAVSGHVAKSIGDESVLSGYSVQVVYNAVDLERFVLPPRFPGRGRLKAGMIARLDQIKDHATLLRAWAIVCSRVPGAELELIGDGDLKASLQLLAGELGVQSSVHFRGWVSDVREIMADWNMVIHATTESEGLGNAMLEAMASGRPLVASDIGPVREVTGNGAAALLVQPRDPRALAEGILETLADQSRVHERVSEAQHCMKNQFSPEVMVSRYLRALQLE